jgi:putative ABC transport system permease protein
LRRETLKKIFTFKYAILLAFILTGLLNIYIDKIIDKEVPNAIVLKSDMKANKLTFNEIDMDKDSDPQLKITGYTEVIEAVKNKFNVDYGNSKIVLSDENLPLIYPMKLIKGSYFQINSASNNKDVAVISDVFSNKLFKSIDVIGNSLNILGKSFEIVGVYKENTSMLYQASSDGYERVYIPYSSYNKDKAYIDVLTVKDSTTTDKELIMNELSSVTGNKIYYYNSYDYSLNKFIIFQIIDFTIFVLGLISIIYILKLVKYNVFEMIKLSKKNLQKYYLFEFIAKEKKVLSKLLLYLIIYISAIGVIINSIKFKIIISDQYIPDNNIFDIEFYKQTLIQHMQAINVFINGMNTMLVMLIENAKKLQWILLVFQLLIMVYVIKNFKYNNAQHKKSFVKIEKFCLPLCLTSFIIFFFLYNINWIYLRSFKFIIVTLLFYSLESKKLSLKS